MSAPVLVVLGWVGGIAFGLASDSTREETSRAALTVAAVFAVSALMPVGITLFLLFPDWSLMYAAHPEHAPMGVALGLITTSLLFAPVLGCLAGRFAGSSFHGRRTAGTLLAFSLLLLAAVLGFGWSRLTVVAFYETFHYGSGLRIALSQSSLFVPVVLSSAALAGVFVFSILHLRRTI